MAVIDLSATIQGSSSTTVEGRLSMSLSATLLGRSASLVPGRPAPSPQTPEQPKNGQQGG